MPYNFRDKLIADPSDRETRLVYADWLEEQGHAHEASFHRWLARLQPCGGCLLTKVDNPLCPFIPPHLTDEFLLPRQAGWHLCNGRWEWGDHTEELFSPCLGWAYDVLLQQKRNRKEPEAVSFADDLRCWFLAYHAAFTRPAKPTPWHFACSLLPTTPLV